MADLNEVRLIGRLTRDPELRSTAGGQYVASLSLATSRKFKGQDGVFRDETTFVEITCWGKTAENVCKYMKKGRTLFVGGRLKFDTWDDKTTGQKRTKLSVVAEQVQFLDSPRNEMGAPYGAPAPYGVPMAPPYGNPASGAYAPTGVAPYPNAMGEVPAQGPAAWTGPEQVNGGDNPPPYEPEMGEPPF